MVIDILAVSCIYTCTYISLITITNKSVMTFISVNKISVCLSVYSTRKLYRPTWLDSNCHCKNHKNYVYYQVMRG